MKKRASAKPHVEEIQEHVIDCKDYVTVRWEFTENGHLAIWQPAEDDENRDTLSIVPEAITDVYFDKTCGLVTEQASDGSKKSKKTVYIFDK